MDTKDYTKGSGNSAGDFSTSNEVLHVHDMKHHLLTGRAAVMELAIPGKVTRIIEDYVYVHFDGHGDSIACIPNNLWGITGSSRKL